MHVHDILLTIAEIAVALAGFGGITAGLGYRASGRWTDQDRGRLVLMAAVSVMLVFACLTPLALERFGGVDPWYAASFVTLAIAAFGLSEQFRIFRRGVPEGYSRLVLFSILSGNTGGLILAASVVSGLAAPDVRPGVYLATVLFLLIVPSALFLRLLVTAFDPRDDE